MHPRCEMSLSNRHGAPQFALIFEDFSLVELAILREKCPNTDLFLVRFFLFCIRTEYDLLRKSPYSVRIQENTDQE